MCYETFNHTYSELFRKLDFEVQHSTEFINEAIQDSKIKLANSTKATIVYQDPCHLGRWSDIYEAPRNVLGNIPRVEIVELQRRRDLARCCGGPIRAAYPELAYGMASRILENAREYEVNKVVTACPTCYHSLYASSWEYEMDVRELTEMVASAMGVASRPAF